MLAFSVTTGVVAIRVPVRRRDGAAVAALSVSMPSVRYERGAPASVVAVLQREAG